MEDETLEEILAKKYNIHENLIAEGTFVALYGIDKEAVQLTAAGISSKSFILAAIALSSEQKDYDLLSITPLSLVTLGIQSFTEKKLFVKSQFKSTQLYQLCSCEDQDSVWMRFVRIIDSLQRKKNMFGDQWRTVPLESSIPMSGVDMQSSDYEHTLMTSSIADMYPWSRDSDSGSSKSSVTRSASTTSASETREIRINVSRSSSSLPENYTENFALETGSSGFRRGQSVGCLNDRYSRLVYQRKLKENFKKDKELDNFSKTGSVECLDVTCTTSSVFSDCESSIVFELEDSSGPDSNSNEDDQSTIHDILVANSENKCQEDSESFMNRSNNFLSSAENRFINISGTDLGTEEDTGSVERGAGFFQRVCGCFFCCEKK